MLRSVLGLAIYTVALTGFVGVAMGQQPTEVSAAKIAEAKALYEAGVAAFTEGRYEDALGYFNRSYQISKRPKLLYNIGQAADRVRRDQEALEAFESYLEQVPDAPNRVEVENRVQALRSVIERSRSKESEEPVAKPVTPEAAPAPSTPEPAPAASTPEPVKVAPASQQPESAAKPSESANPIVSSGQLESREDKGGLLSKWWFWTAAAVVVAAAATGIAIAAGGGKQKDEEPLTGSGGVVFTALGRTP